MTDAEKCRLIAEFEGLSEFNPYVDNPTIASAPNGPVVPIDYPHDLNATMRAALRLPGGFCFELLVRSDMGVCASIHQPAAVGTQIVALSAGGDDAARAAFEALFLWCDENRAAWLMERGK